MRDAQDQTTSRPRDRRRRFLGSDHAEGMTGRARWAGRGQSVQGGARTHRQENTFHTLTSTFRTPGVTSDNRNYIVSNARLRDAGLEACRSLDDGIQELLKGYRVLARVEA